MASSLCTSLKVSSTPMPPLLRFIIVGGTGVVVYTLLTTVLATVASIPFQAALAIGFFTALAVHFTLQRVYVWAHHERFALPLKYQLCRYLTASGVQYVATVASTSVLPSVLGLPTEAVYIATVLTLATVNFLVFRDRIFHAVPSSTTSSTFLR